MFEIIITKSQRGLYECFNWVQATASKVDLAAQLVLCSGYSIRHSGCRVPPAILSRLVLLSRHGDLVHFVSTNYYYYYYYSFLPLVGIFLRKFKNWKIEIQMDGYDYQPVQSAETVMCWTVAPTLRHRGTVIRLRDSSLLTEILLTILFKKRQAEELNTPESPHQLAQGYSDDSTRSGQKPSAVVQFDGVAYLSTISFASSMVGLRKQSIHPKQTHWIKSRLLSNAANVDRVAVCDDFVCLEVSISMSTALKLHDWT